MIILLLLSGIFFDENGSRILDLVEPDLVTSEDVVRELRQVVKRKLKYLRERTFEIAVAETEKAAAAEFYLRASREELAIDNKVYCRSPYSPSFP